MSGLRELKGRRQASDTGKGAPAGTPTPDPADQLRKLAELRDAGITTAEEFEAKKSDVLARM